MSASPGRDCLSTFLGSAELARLLGEIGPLGCLDIGARGGIVEDIRPLGKASAVYGFEPDADACRRLNEESSRGGHPFGLLRYLPVALGPGEAERELNLMRHPGASSILPPDPSFACRFAARSAYFEIARTIKVDTRPLDRVIEEQGIANPVYMKIDVEGFELEVLNGAERLLASNLLALRAEIAFTPVRIGQPDFGTLAAYLKRFGFMPMGFLYLANWRTLTAVKHPRKIGGPIPYSRGQMIHGDVLFLKDPRTLDRESEEAVTAKLRLACLALLYDYVDFAHDIFKEPEVAARLRRLLGDDGIAALATASRHLARRHDRGALRHWARNLAKRVTAELRYALVRKPATAADRPQR